MDQNIVIWLIPIGYFLFMLLLNWDIYHNLKIIPKKKSSSEIEKISKKLNQIDDGFDFTYESLLDESRDNQRKEIISDLYYICRSIDEISEILDDYSITRDEFDEIFFKLDAFGFARWEGNHFLITAVLSDKKALTYLLSHIKNREIYADSDLQISANLVRYFKSGEKLDEPMPPEVFFMVLYKVKNSALELSHLLGVVPGFNKERQNEYIELCHDAYRAYVKKHPLKQHVERLFRAAAELQEIWKSDPSRTTGETFDSIFSPKEGWDSFYKKMYR